MKRLIIALGLLVSSNCYAATISIQPWISSNDVTIAHLETQRTTIQNVINGNIEGGAQNIRQGSITSYDLATAINPVTFRDEAFNDWTYSGMLPPTSASLSTTITAGVSYVNGVRVETAATAHTFTASKDTYLYINSGGYFDYVEVANGASAPSTPANDLLLAKVVTNGTTVSGVSDLRTTSIQITVNGSNFPADYRSQCYFSRDTTTTMHAEAGQIAIGTTLYTRTSATSTKTLNTGSNWIEGGYPSGIVKNCFAYAYNDSGTSWDIKFSSADPVYSDTSSNTAGILRYYTSGGTTYRAIGWMYVSADTVQVWNHGNITDVGVDNATSQTGNDTISTASTTLIDVTSTLTNFYTIGRNVEIGYDAAVDCNNSTGLVDHTIDINGTPLRKKTMTDSGGAVGGIPFSMNTLVKLPQGSHAIKVKWDTSAGTVSQRGATSVRKIIIKEL